MSEVVIAKEKSACPGPDSCDQIETEIISIKVERCIDWESPSEDTIFPESSKNKEIIALLSSTTIKKEPSEDQAYDGETNESLLSQNFDSNAISEHFLAFTSGNKYNCQICFKSFANGTNLHRHSLIHTRVKLGCHICGKQYVGQELLDKHLENHENPKKLHPCDVCNKSFKTPSHLRQHKRVHLPTKPHQCDKCKKIFSFRTSLSRHKAGSNRCKPVNEEPLICKICNKMFDKSFLLKSHLRKHDTDKPYECDLCGLAFKYKSAIIRHMQWHSGYRPYKCKYCPKTFTHSGLIKPHLRTHTGEKPYQCSICLKLFTHKHNMERHKINHGRIKRLVCDICNKKFPKESRLRYHMKTHITEKFFDCGKCDKKFTHKSNVIRHYQRKHPGFKYKGKETDAKVAMRVWDNLKDLLRPHYDIYQQPEGRILETPAPRVPVNDDQEKIQLSTSTSSQITSEHPRRELKSLCLRRPVARQAAEVD